MSEAEERRIAAILAQIDNRLPEQMPTKRPEWQVWTFLAVAIFYGGASWLQIEQNNVSIKKHLAADNKRMAEIEARVEENKENLVQHMQWEFKHEIELRDAEIKKLKGRVQ